MAVLNVTSAALFIGLVNRPVYDDSYNMADVHRYASRSISLASLRSNSNSPGPTSFLWMATAVRVLGVEELRDARVGALLSWLILIAGVFAGARHSNFPGLWYAALLVLLVFPHTPTAMATVLTEGPALLFAVLGALAWVEFISRPAHTPTLLFLGVLAGLSMGIATTARQYFLALLPAAGLFALIQWRRSRFDRNSTWILKVIVSLAIAIVPFFLLVLVWKGPSSPASHSNWGTSLGVNLSRPVVALFYTLLYLVPLTFPIMLGLPARSRRLALSVGALAGVTAAGFSASVLQPGPLRSFIHFVARTSVNQELLVGLVAAVTVYNAAAITHVLWKHRSTLFSAPPVVFVLLVISFFVVEQVGVGGNPDFLDRYVLQMGPFLGLLAFALLRRLTFTRILGLASMWIVGQIMLWRYFFYP